MTTDTMEPIEARTLPHSLEAEKAVLGAVLLHENALTDAAEIVKPEHFFRKAHQTIFATMCALVVDGRPVELVTLKDALGKVGQLEEIGGAAYLTALVDGMPRSVNIAAYAQIVRDKSDLRTVIFAGQKMLAQAYEADRDAHLVVEDAERTLSELANVSDRHGFTSVGTLLQAAMDRIELIYQTKKGVTGVPTGFTLLDELLRGLQPGNLILVAGRPSMGKTSFAINIAEHVSIRTDLVVGVFSLEMSKDELVMRSLASTAGIDGHRMQSGYLGERDWGRLAHAMGVIGDARMHIDDAANVGVFEMRARARRLKQEHGLDLLIIDYVQLMTSTEKRAENRTLELGAISRALKGLAKELGIPIVLLSQLSRAPELRADHRPMLSDLRESGSLEQDADVVLFLYRDEYYHPDRDDNKGIAEVIVAKQRNGPIGTIKLCFLRELTRFENLADDNSRGYEQLPLGDRP